MRVVIAEDDALLREGLAALLRGEGIHVVAVTDTADDLGDLVSAHDADLSVVDVRMPPTWTDEGLRSAIEIRRSRPDHPVLVLSAHVEPASAGELLADGAGSVGYLLKERVAAVEDFIRAVHRVASGHTVLDPEVARILMQRRRSPLAALTDRERDVLELLAQGDRNSEIAAKLFVSEAAISKHIRNLFDKLGLHIDDAGHRRVLAVLTYLREK
ncbi:DNA-binding NarL/FixJ family response regulator [Lipingzhangella halophila]|uniref:DNA-binding NarL/FixJ family response regulator n=1 Tax=Lipingzhangella halophila TaxID=1783352 RepID=A0A7W7W3T4_9ACTN|nr:response regulator transcription factor [Lipingzhangella halophila]MBB4932863.1 DNA-binding NarL/FixJ family response regulator [Lipingzhangella halophila]